MSLASSPPKSRLSHSPGSTGAYSDRIHIDQELPLTHPAACFTGGVGLDFITFMGHAITPDP